MYRNKAHGFSLLETMIYLGVVTVVSSAFVGTFISVDKAKRRHEQVSQVHATERAIMNVIKSDMAGGVRAAPADITPDEFVNLHVRNREEVKEQKIKIKGGTEKENSGGNGVKGAAVKGKEEEKKTKGANGVEVEKSPSGKSQGKVKKSAVILTGENGDVAYAPVKGKFLRRDAVGDKIVGDPRVLVGEFAFNTRESYHPRLMATTTIILYEGVLRHPEIPGEVFRMKGSEVIK